MEKKFENEWESLKAKLPEIFIGDRVDISSENAKAMCKGFFAAGRVAQLEEEILRTKKIISLVN